MSNWGNKQKQQNLLSPTLVLKALSCLEQLKVLLCPSVWFPFFHIQSFLGMLDSWVHLPLYIRNLLQILGCLRYKGKVNSLNHIFIFFLLSMLKLSRCPHSPQELSCFMRYSTGDLSDLSLVSSLFLLIRRFCSLEFS